ncbi:MAG: anthranilate synthase component I [Acidimicrobiaceae bacterium]|nr:anthranilate synthase component I [Acidimicrobiaceae bacterium]
MSLSFSDFDSIVHDGFNTVALTETLQLDRDTPVSIYQRFAEGRAFCLLESAALGDDTGRYSFIGLDRLWRLHSYGDSIHLEGRNDAVNNLGALATLRDLLATYRTYAPSDLPAFFGGAVGFVTYDYVRRLEDLPRADDPNPWPDVDFSFPASVLICDHLRHSTTVVVLATLDDGASAQVAYEEASQRLESIVEVLLAPAPSGDALVERLVATAPMQRTQIDVRSLAASLSNFTLERYADVVTRAREYIYAGDIFQVVPSQQFTRPTNVNPLTLYRVLRSLNPSPYMYLIDTGESQIVGASPEMLVRVDDHEVTTRPIAGTRPRGVTDAADRALEVEILQDEKEIAEHVMLVDLGRNDVGRVSVPGTVRVERLAHVERFSHLMHLVSQVSGQLRDGLDAFDAFDALFPAGTLSGAPKVRAMQIIDEFEPVRRGPYGGALGYFSLRGDADFAITIRTVSLRQGVATVQAGGGVVADSTPEFEYQECISKASAPLLALEIVDPYCAPPAMKASDVNK